MFKKSLFYQNSFLYLLSLKLLHKCDISLRDKFIANLINRNEIVLEPACGPGTLADSLPDKKNYVGFDLNKSFISYGLKRGLNVCVGNVLDKKNYRKADVIIICDILHHLKLKDREKLIKYSYSCAKRLFIICECVIEREGLLKKIISPIGKKFFELLDNDGINKPEYENVYTKIKLQTEIKNGFNVIPEDKKRVLKQFGCDLVAVFYKE